MSGIVMQWFEVILVLVALYLLLSSKNTSQVLGTLGNVNTNAIRALQGR
jgi:hypothetical protein